MIQIGVGMPSASPNPMLPMNGDVTYVVCVCDQRLTMPW